MCDMRATRQRNNLATRFVDPLDGMRESKFGLLHHVLDKAVNVGMGDFSCQQSLLGEHHDAQLVTAALQMAVANRGGDVSEAIFHSDRGSEYTSALYNDTCRRLGVVQSMGRAGSALDNAVAESFNSVLKVEFVHRHTFATRAEARIRVAMGRLLQDRTSIVIAHRLSTVLTADRIIVMEGGRVVQAGEPHELYRHPSSRFVAEFISSANIFAGRALASIPKGIWRTTPAS